MYFAATIAIHHSAARGDVAFHGGVDFGPYLVDRQQGGGIHGGGVS